MEVSSFSPIPPWQENVSHGCKPCLESHAPWLQSSWALICFAFLHEGHTWQWQGVRMVSWHAHCVSMMWTWGQLGLATRGAWCTGRHNTWPCPRLPVLEIRGQVWPTSLGWPGHWGGPSHSHVGAWGLICLHVGAFHG